MITKELKLIVNDCEFCKHADGHYSLNIDLDDTNINVSSHGYDHKAGNHISIWFNVSPQQMLELAHKIEDTVKKIQNEN